MKVLNKIALMAVLAVVLSAPLVSYAGGPGFDDDVDDYEECNDIPLDGGLSLLAVAGVAYGAKRLKGRKSSEEKEK